MNLLAYVMWDLNYVPFKELAVISLHLQSMALATRKVGWAFFMCLTKAFYVRQFLLRAGNTTDLRGVQITVAKVEQVSECVP